MSAKQGRKPRPTRRGVLVLPVFSACLLVVGSSGGCLWSQIPSQAVPGQSPEDRLGHLVIPGEDALEELDPAPVLDEAGTGSAEFRIADPRGAGVTFYVACAPQGDFGVRAYDNFFAGSCDGLFGSSGRIPVVQEASSGDTVTLDIPEGTAYRIVGLAEEH